jgi:hypothetical protein
MPRRQGDSASAAASYESDAAPSQPANQAAHRQFALPAAFTLNLEHFAAKRARTLRLHGSSLAIRCTGVGCRRGRALRCRSRRCATKKKRTFFVTLSCPITNAASCQTRRRSEKPVCVDELGWCPGCHP